MLKDKIFRDKKYLIWLRGERCIFTGKKANDYMSVVAHHIGTAGKGIKSPDNETLPMISSYHSEVHSQGEATTYRLHLPDDVLIIAMKAYAREQNREYNK